MIEFNQKTPKIKTLLAAAVVISMLACDNVSKSGNKEKADDSIKNISQPALVDSAGFSKVLTFGDVSFDIACTREGSLEQVMIQSFGPSIEKKVITMKLDPVISAEIGDLNGDGHAELLLFTQSAGSGSYGKVVGFSVNDNGKSISQVSFPETSSNPKINKGYMGHDKFSITNNQLTQEFPLYNPGDTNAQPSGKRRIVTYKLVDGEASRVFVVDKLKEI